MLALVTRRGFFFCPSPLSLFVHVSHPVTVNLFFDVTAALVLGSLNNLWEAGSFFLFSRHTCASLTWLWCKIQKLCISPARFWWKKTVCMCAFLYWRKSVFFKKRRPSDPNLFVDGFYIFSRAPSAWEPWDLIVRGSLWVNTFSPEKSFSGMTFFGKARVGLKRNLTGPVFLDSQARCCTKSNPMLNQLHTILFELVVFAKLAILLNLS